MDFLFIATEDEVEAQPSQGMKGDWIKVGLCRFQKALFSPVTCNVTCHNVTCHDVTISPVCIFKRLHSEICFQKHAFSRPENGIVVWTKGQNVFAETQRFHRIVCKPPNVSYLL